MDFRKNISHSGAILFFLIIFFVPLIMLINFDTSGQRSLIEGRKLNVFPNLSFQDFKKSSKRILQGKFNEAGEVFYNQFFDQKFQKDFEAASSDQFPLRMDLIYFSKFMDRSIISIPYAVLPDKAYPADMHSGWFIMRDKSMLIHTASTYSKQVEEKIDKRIENYNYLLEKYPDLNFYLLYHERLTNSPYDPLNKYFWDVDNRQAFNYFANNKPQGLVLETFLLNDFSDFSKYYYHTDHHWNVYGALHAYELIYDLVKENYSEISPILNHEKIVRMPDLKFLGSYARSSFYPIKPDEFDMVELQLPPYKIFENGEEITYNKIEEYLSGKYSTDLYISHYSKYFGNDKAFLHYKFENGSQRNLLLIGSSFTKSIEVMIASHYKNTYRIDLRYLEDFSFSEFIKGKEIEDVLIVGDNSVAFQSLTWIIDP